MSDTRIFVVEVNGNVSSSWHRYGFLVEGKFVSGQINRDILRFGPGSSRDARTGRGNVGPFD